MQQLLGDVLFELGALGGGRFGVVRIVVDVFEFDIAAAGNVHGVAHRFGEFGEEQCHLLGALEVELVGLEFHPLGVVDGGLGADADHQVLCGGVLFPQVVRVIGDHHSDAELLGQCDEPGVHKLLVGEAVVLQFDVVVFLSEEVAVLSRKCLRLFVSVA